MFSWITFLLLLGVTLCDNDAGNVIGSCGKGNTTMCKFRNCDMVHTRMESKKNFIKLEHINGSKTFAYKMRLVVFIRGAGNCHIVLSPVFQFNREKDAFYDFVIGGLNNSRTIIRRQSRIVISQSTNNVLSSDEPIEFKIEISSHGEINIYREGHKIVQAFSPNPLDVNYVSLGCLDSDAMDYYYNCRENDDFDESDQLKDDLFAYAGSGVYYSRSVPQTSTSRLVAMNVIFSFLSIFCGTKILKIQK